MHGPTSRIRGRERSSVTGLATRLGRAVCTRFSPTESSSGVAITDSKFGSGTHPSRRLRQLSELQPRQAPLKPSHRPQGARPGRRPSRARCRTSHSTSEVARRRHRVRRHPRKMSQLDRACERTLAPRLPRRRRGSPRTDENSIGVRRGRAGSRMSQRLASLQPSIVLPGVRRDDEA